MRHSINVGSGHPMKIINRPSEFHSQLKYVTFFAHSEKNGGSGSGSRPCLLVPMHDQGGTKGLAAPVLVILHRIEQVLEHGPLKSHPVHMWTEGHQGSNHGLVGKRHQDGRAQPPSAIGLAWR